MNNINSSLLYNNNKVLNYIETNKELIDEYVLRYPKLLGSEIYNKFIATVNFFILEFSIC